MGKFPGGSSSNSGAGGNGFKPLGLSEPVYKGIVRMGFRMPTPVQRKSIPVVLTGTDTVVMARTGSGKTCAFLVPLLEKLAGEESSGSHSSNNLSSSSTSYCRAVILSPTRELSIQTLKVMNKLSHFMPEIRCIGIHGGEGMEKQFDLLSQKPDVIIATPGRLAHHLSEIPDFTLSGCAMCVLDEADRLLEMGFASQIRQIVRTMPEYCQKVLLSATIPKVLVEFTRTGFCSMEPNIVRLDQDCNVSEELRIAFIATRSTDKDAALLYLLQTIIQQDLENHGGGAKNNSTSRSRRSSSSIRTGLTLIFAATRHHVEYITYLLQASGIESTMIYGTLDHEARNNNLRHFRSGQKPILVVTDVAARGIDVPLIDHVIHYHFPSSSKLFVHRSGRAARAGRIGFCWGLVDPEEMPYMMDLHLFLGRKPTTGNKGINSSIDNNNDKQQEETGKEKENSSVMYTLNEMTPDMVHYGSIPTQILTQEVENVQRIMHSELTGSLESESLRSLTKTCNNAMKQYRRTRSEASREGVRRAKAILEGERLQTGQRIGGGAVPTHPLFKGQQQKLQILQQQSQKRNNSSNNNIRQQLLDKKRNGTTGNSNSNDSSNSNNNNLSDFYKCEQMLQAISNFRPKETVFEAFATGGKGKEVGVASQIDKGRTSSKKQEHNIVALKAMKNMRRQMRIVRDKGTTLVVAGSSNAKKLNGENNDNDDDDNDDNNDHGSLSHEEDDGGDDEDSNKQEEEGENDDNNDVYENYDNNNSGEEEVEVDSNNNKDVNAVAASDINVERKNKKRLIVETTTKNNQPNEEQLSLARGGEKKKKSNVVLDTLVSHTNALSNNSNNNYTGKKRRMSRAERRRLKNNHFNSTNTTTSNNNNDFNNNNTTNKAKFMRGNDFRDSIYYMDNDFTSNPEEASRARQIEASLQPSSSAKGMHGAAHRMEEAMLDVLGDENEQLVQKQRMMRWDKSKRKYVQTTVGAELSGSNSESKKMRLESGQRVSSSKIKLGELYTKWQKKTNKSIGRTGVFDDSNNHNDNNNNNNDGLKGMDHKKGGAGKNKNNKNKSGNKNNSNKNNSIHTKSSMDIKKEREQTENMRMKNMKKGDRRHLEQRQRSVKEQKQNNNNNGNRKRRR